MTLSMLLGCAAVGMTVLGIAGTPHAADKPAETSKARATFASTEERININTATEAELGKLKGIGRTVARKIIEYRDAHGGFKRPEDIRKVEGVGKGLWEQNRERIVVR